MNLTTYFESTRGTGVLATADRNGTVNTAIFARPHVFEDGTIAFIMGERLTHKNLGENPHASYLFREIGEGYKGIRLHLTKTREEKDTERVRDLCRFCQIHPEITEKGSKYLVYFAIDKTFPLIGPGE